MRKEYQTIARIGFLFVMMYMIGAGLAGGVNAWKQTSVSALEEKDWGLGFGENGQKPTGNSSSEELKKLDAYYVDDAAQEKVLYLTFDAGFENGNTPAILDALKKHHAPATFFVVGNYLETSPELVKRMADEGHTVGNHSWHHPDMTKKSKEEFIRELKTVENKYKEITGCEMTKFYRPPQGKYNEETLCYAKELGYKTFFWSLAYVDWIEDKQPSREEAFEKLLGRIHPGAIVLLHSTSATNAQILDELLGKWEEMGYQVRPLSEIH